MTCTPSWFRFRWAKGRYFTLLYTSVCVGFGYRFFPWWSFLPLGPGRKSPRYIYIYLLVCDHWPTALSCWLLGPSPAEAEWGQSLGYGWVAYGFGWDLSSLSFVGVSVLSLVVQCWGGGFAYGLHVCGGFWFVVFRPVRSSVVSTHSTGRFGVGQGPRVLSRGMRDGG